MHTRTRYLIQHRESKRYIQYAIDHHNDTLTLTSDPWKAWGMHTVQEALHVLEEHAFMPKDKAAYRIVHVEDTRQEVEESENE